jgi:surface antigen
MSKFAIAFVATLLTIGWASETYADPPPWAPAHGYRAKGKDKGKRSKYYVGYSGREYDRDFDIVRGRCDREKVGAVIGGVIGGVIGNEVASRDNRVIATVLGAAAGALIGAKIGRNMDERDRACWGQALELGTTGRRIYWVNETDGMRYEVTPGNGTRDAGRVCREYSLVEISGRDRIDSNGRACQVRPGEWQVER